MGNCCEKTKNNDKDFNLINILSFREKGKKDLTENKEKQINNKEEVNPILLINYSEVVNNPLEKKKVDENNSNQESRYKTNFGQFSNYLQPTESNGSLLVDINLQINSPRFYRVLTQTFSVNNILPEEIVLFSIKFLEELNLARTDFLAFSNKLENYIMNYDLFTKKINELNDDFKKDFERSKKDFKEASDFFKSLNNERIKENKNKLNSLILRDELKLQFPSETKELFNLEYYNKSLLRINEITNESFKFGKLDCQITHLDPEISFLLYITEKIKENDTQFLFKEEMKYFGLNYKLLENNTIVTCIIISG